MDNRIKIIPEPQFKSRLFYSISVLMISILVGLFVISINKLRVFFFEDCFPGLSPVINTITTKIEDTINNWFFNANESKYAAAKAIIGAVGIGGYAVSSISAFKEKRTHGILHTYVLRLCFPMTSWFYVLHILFIIFGLYACEMLHPVQIGCSLIGVTICFLNSLVILMGTELSPTINRILINQLKKYTIRHGFSGLLANDVAVYINQSHKNRSIQGGSIIFAGDTYDLKLVSDLIALDPSAKEQLIKINGHTEIRPGSFKNSLREEILSSKPYPAHSITTNLYPANAVIDQIRKCCAMWESLAFLEGNTYAATALLSYTYSQKDYLSAIALLSGLLLYLRYHHMNESETKDNGWEKSCTCLNNWVSSYNLGDHDYAHQLQESVALLSVCLLCWEQQILLKSLKEETVEKIAKKSAQFSGGKIDIASLYSSEFMDFFISYAFLICKTYDKKVCHNLGENDVKRMTPSVLRQLKALKIRFI